MVSRLSYMSTDSVESCRLCNGFTCVRAAYLPRSYPIGSPGANRMARGLDFGVVWINTHIPFASEMPHGGCGERSGPLLLRRRLVARNFYGKPDLGGRPA